MTNRAEEQLEVIALLIHSTLFSLHVVGIAHNLRKRQKWDVVAHSLAAAYDLNAMISHVSNIKELDIHHA